MDSSGSKYPFTFYSNNMPLEDTMFKEYLKSKDIKFNHPLASGFAYDNIYAHVDGKPIDPRCDTSITLNSSSIVKNLNSNNLDRNDIGVDDINIGIDDIDIDDIDNNQMVNKLRNEMLNDEKTNNCISYDSNNYQIFLGLLVILGIIYFR